MAGGGITEKPDYLIPGFMTVRSILVRPHFVAEDFVFDVVCILLQYNTTTTVYYLSYRIVIIANRHVFSLNAVSSMRGIKHREVKYPKRVL